MNVCSAMNFIFKINKFCLSSLICMVQFFHNVTIFSLLSGTDAVFLVTSTGQTDKKKYYLSSFVLYVAETTSASIFCTFLSYFSYRGA